MQIHVTLAGSDNALPQKLADAEIHFGNGPLKGLRLIGFSVEKGRKDGEIAVKLPARVYTVAGERREYSLVQALAAGTTAELEREILAAYGEAVKTADATARNAARGPARSPAVRKAVEELVDGLGIVDALLCVANECLERASGAKRQGDTRKEAGWRRAAMQIGHTAQELEGSDADQRAAKPPNE